MNTTIIKVNYFIFRYMYIYKKVSLLSDKIIVNHIKFCIQFLELSKNVQILRKLSEKWQN